MRIAIDIRALMEGKTTGVEVYLKNLLENLFSIDQKNEYVLFANSFRNISANLPHFDYPNVQMKITRYPNKFFNLAQKLGFPKLERLLGKIDVFFSPHWRAIALRKTTPLVVTFHDLFFEIWPDFFTWRRRIWHYFMNYRGAADKAERIIAVSANTKQDLQEIYGIDEKKIAVIYPGVHNAPQPPLNLRGGEGELKYFLYFGTFEPRKNIKTVLAAYAQYCSRVPSPKDLVIAGSQGWKTRINLPARLEHKITVKQNVSDAEKIEIYRNAFALIFPSFYEGFGFPILEAASHGLPVIAGYNSSAAEIGKDFVLFVNPLRASQLAMAMLELEKDEKLWADLGNRGLRAAKNFNWQTTAEQTLRVFQEAAA